MDNVVFKRNSAIWYILSIKHYTFSIHQKFRACVWPLRSTNNGYWKAHEIFICVICWTFHVTGPYRILGIWGKSTTFDTSVYNQSSTDVPTYTNCLYKGFSYNLLSFDIHGSRKRLRTSGKLSTFVASYSNLL